MAAHDHREVVITIRATLNTEPYGGREPLAAHLRQMAANAVVQVEEPVVDWDDSGNELLPLWDTEDITVTVTLDGEPLND